jgi:metal-responsive CopG/Arc/MetJ family transcriptional regulator
MAMNARLAGELEALLNEYCDRTGSSRSEVMREALTTHLKANKRRIRPNRDIKRIMTEHWRGKRAA